MMGHIPNNCILHSGQPTEEITRSTCQLSPKHFIYKHFSYEDESFSKISHQLETNKQTVIRSHSASGRSQEPYENCLGVSGFDPCIIVPRYLFFHQSTKSKALQFFFKKITFPRHVSCSKMRFFSVKRFFS